MSMAMAYGVHKRKNMASGGKVCEPDSKMAEGGLVDRIMAKRKGMSEGGEVANDTPVTADFEDNDFDDLAKDDDLESSYTGANSGDETGGMSEDDMIDRIMMKRRKDRNPVPA